MAYTDKYPLTRGDEPEVLETEMFEARTPSQVEALLESVLQYYDRTKQVGHTRSLFTGIGFLNPMSNLRPTVVAANKELGRMISSSNNVSLEEFPKWSLRSRDPLIWDNSAIIMVLSQSLQRIRELEDMLGKSVVTVSEFESLQGVAEVRLIQGEVIEDCEDQNETPKA